MENAHLAMDNGLPTFNVDTTSTSTPVVLSRCSSTCREKRTTETEGQQSLGPAHDLNSIQDTTTFEKAHDARGAANYDSMAPFTKQPLRSRFKTLFSSGGTLQPFRLLKQDVSNIKKRYVSDWTLFNQFDFCQRCLRFLYQLTPRNYFCW
jgi:hypothetical protein